MTRRLYYDDAYTTDFEATVVAAEDAAEGLWHVVLDATLFYPTSGGQMHDRGRLGGAEVVDVVDEGGRIVHVVAGPFEATPGARVRGEIDAERRRHHRQQHSGQHVLSRVVEDRLGLPTLSSRLGETGNTLDLGTEGIDPATLRQLEDETNRRLWEAHPVRVRYLEEEVAAKEGLRKKVEREGPLRVIDVEGVDRCACGGTHVRNTAEVGVVVLVGTEKIRGGTRIHFHCGERAVAFRRERQAWLDATALALSSGADQVEEKVRSLLQETKDRQKRLGALAAELVRTRAGAWLREAEPRTLDGHPLRLVLRRLDADEALALAPALHALVETPDVLAVLASVDGEKAQVQIARGAQLECDCGRVLREALAEVGGKGGGKPDHARGGCAAPDLDRLWSWFQALGRD